MKKLLLLPFLCCALFGAQTYNVQTPAKVPVAGAVPLGNGTNWYAGGIIAGSNATVTLDGTNLVISATGGGGGGSGTVTSVSVTTANGVSGSVATATTTPAITLTLGAITPSSVNSVVLSGSSTPTLAVTGTTTVSGSNTGDQTSVSGNAGTATALATGRTISISGDLTYTSPTFNGTGNVTAAGTLATVNGNVGAFGNGSFIPTITVNAKGLITAVTTNAVTAGGTGDVVGPSSSTDNAVVRFDSTTGKLIQNSIVTIDDSGNIAGINDFSIANLIVTNAIAVTSGGTGRATSTTAYGLLAAGTTATGAHQTLAAGATNEILVGGGASALPVWTAATGTGAPVRGTAPTITLSNGTGLPISTGVSGLGTGIATALAVNTGTTGSPMILGGNGDIRYKLVPAGFSTENSTAITTGQIPHFTTASQAGTITGWAISVYPSGTCTVKVWKIAAGTANPTIANVINTSGVSLSSGDHVRSTTTSDFTTTAVALGDIIGYDITATSGVATSIDFKLEITAQ